MQKTKRLLAIENIITEENISTQEELLKTSERERDKLYTGYTVPQFKAAGSWQRIPDGTGDYKYSLSENVRNPAGSSI